MNFQFVINNIIKWKNLNNDSVLYLLGVLMTEEESNIYQLKVPSMMGVVTTENIKKFIEILPKVPDEFENSDISNIKEYPLNYDDAIARVLSYFKYLDILTEERKSKRHEGSINYVQLFHLTDKGKELKQTAIINPTGLFEKWKEILKSSELYYSLTNNEEFNNYGHISKVALRKLIINSFSKNVKNPKDRIDKAENYIIKFLQDFDLFYLEKDFLKPVQQSKIATVSNDNSSGEIPISTLGNLKDNKQASILSNKNKQIQTGFINIQSEGHFDLNIKRNQRSLKILKGYIEALENEFDTEIEEIDE